MPRSGVVCELRSNSERRAWLWCGARRRVPWRPLALRLLLVTTNGTMDPFIEEAVNAHIFVRRIAFDPFRGASAGAPLPRSLADGQNGTCRADPAMPDAYGLPVGCLSGCLGCLIGCLLLRPCAQRRLPLPRQAPTWYTT